jgi:signal transduction histidine kinase
MRPLRNLLRRLARRTHRRTDADLLLRAVCHELRPPLCTINALVTELDRLPAGDDRHALLQLALEHTRHAEAVLHQVAGTTHHPGGPALPLHRILPVVVAAVPAHRLAVDVSPAAAGCPVHPQHTRQILINLLDNAARHGPPGAPVTLHCHVRARRLHLVIGNGGPLSPELARSLRRRTPPAGTTGLGLWVVRHLVSAHRGTVAARARPAGGVAVEVTLPPA